MSGSAKALRYSIACVSTGRGWRYRATLWCGRVGYQGQPDYERHQDAERAAKATGAVPREPAATAEGAEA